MLLKEKHCSENKLVPIKPQKTSFRHIQIHFNSQFINSVPSPLGIQMAELDILTGLGITNIAK